MLLYFLLKWKEMFDFGYHRRILLHRFNGKACKEAAKLILTLNFKVNIFFLFALYSIKMKLFQGYRNLMFLLENGKKIFCNFW